MNAFQSDDGEIILLYDTDGQVSGEMAYGEFEAVLFRAANLAPHANKLLRCVYVVVDEQLEFSAAVFFLLKVDERGDIPDFMLPLEQLAASAPELAGAAGRRLVSRGLCADERTRSELWEPTAAMVSDLVHVVRERAPRLLGRVQSSERDVVAPTEAVVETPAMRSMLSELEAARDEIRRLRSALRHEQDRNRRLQDALVNR